MDQNTVQNHCAASGDVLDSKCIASTITTVIQALMVGDFNSGTIRFLRFTESVKLAL